MTNGPKLLASMLSQLTFLSTLFNFIGRFAREGQNNKGMLEMRTNNNWIKLARNLNENQEQWLKDYRDGSEAERQVMVNMFYPSVTREDVDETF